MLIFSAFSPRHDRYVDMNYLVHSIMYTYYALKACRIRVNRKLAIFVTSLQLLQMVLGGYVSLVAYRSKVAGDDCFVPPWSSTLAVLMYATYFLLFAHFFVNAYIANGGRGKKTPTTTSSAAVNGKANGKANGLANGDVKNGHAVTNGSSTRRRPKKED